MLRRSRFALRSTSVLSVLLALTVLAVAAAPSLASTSLSTYEKQVVKYVNQERAKKGLSKLKVNASLVAAARAHSSDMGENKYFEHESLDGASFADRIIDHGYTREGYKSWRTAENIAWGAGLFSSPVAIVDRWMDSPVHRGVILDRSLREIGVGAVSTQGYGPVEGTVWFFTMDAGLRGK